LLFAPQVVLNRVHHVEVDTESVLVARVLGARHLTQAALSGINPSPEVLAMGVWVDVARLHRGHCGDPGEAGSNHRTPGTGPGGADLPQYRGDTSQREAIRVAAGFPPHEQQCSRQRRCFRRSRFGGRGVPAPPAPDPGRSAMSVASQRVQWLGRTSTAAQPCQTVSPRTSATSTDLHRTNAQEVRSTR